MMEFLLLNIEIDDQQNVKFQSNDKLNSPWIMFLCILDVI